MAGFTNGKIHKDGCASAILGGVKDGKVYKGTSSGNIIGGVAGGKVYKGSCSTNTFGSVKDCAIKGMEREDEALMVAAYHFLVKSIF